MLRGTQGQSGGYAEVFKTYYLRQEGSQDSSDIHLVLGYRSALPRLRIKCNLE